MSKALKKDFRREIKKNFSRFISILLIVVLGVAFYSGIRSSMPAMQMSADAIYDKQNVMDIRVVSPLGLTDGDLKAISAIDGVSKIEGSYTTDFLCLANSEEIVTKVISMTDSINDIKVTKGRYPEKYNECLVSEEFLRESGLEIGGFMTLITGTDASVFDTLAADSYEIVGVCSSALFLNGDAGTSSIGDGVVDGYAVIPKQAFVTDVYTSIYLTVEGAAELDCYGDDYKALVDRVIGDIERISEKRCDIRYSEVRSQSSELLNEARDKYNSSEITAKLELAEAYQKLVDSEEVLKASRAEFEKQKELLQNSDTYIPQLEQSIADGEAEIANNRETVETLRASIKNAESTMNTRKAEWDELVKKQEENPDDATIAAQAEKAKQDYDSARLAYQVLYAGATPNINKYDEGVKKLADAKETLRMLKNFTEGNTDVIAEAEKKLQDAEIKLQRGREQYELSKQDALDELADAAAKLTESENEINNMKIPVWYVLDRTSIESYASYVNDSESIGAIGTVFPIIFFLVAALVSLTTMTRMVEEQRTQIGTLKALGYSKASIMGKYIMYALLASVIGSVIGILLGEYTIPEIIVRAYKMLYYNLEGTVVRLNLKFGLAAAGAAVLCTTLAAFAACYKELRSVPAELMRPEAPKIGKKTLIERITFIWDRLNFSQKSALRNLFRYKKRFFMTLFGVGGCMALLLVGLGVRDSVSAMANNQFGKVFKYDATVNVDATLTRAQRRAMLSELNDISDIEGYLQANRTMVYSAASGDSDFENEKNAYLIVPRDVEEFEKYYVSLKERSGLQNELKLSDDGVIITEKYADLLGVKVNDKIFIRQSESDAYPREVKVIGITENYIFNYIYMTPTLYQSIYLTPADVNMLMVRTVDSVNEDDFSARLLQIKGINSVSMNSEQLVTLNDTINRLYFVIIIMILAAGVLAFVVLYNLNNINISERRRELATIKLLGFYDGELAGYVYRENIILTLLGTLLGVFLGILLHKFVMVTVETDVFMFGRELSPWSILIGAVLTVIFSAIVNFIMYFKLKKIDMVESLKSVE